VATLVAPMKPRASDRRSPQASGALGDDARRIRATCLYGWARSRELMHANACADEHRVVMNVHHNFTPEQA
jgi:hypothetical protein